MYILSKIYLTCLAPLGGPPSTLGTTDICTVLCDLKTVD